MEKFKTLNGYEVKDEFARNNSQNALTRIGDLTTLDTTDKTSVVNAINEVFNDVSGDSTKIGDLNNLHTTDKTNIVNAINETDDYAHNIRQVDIGIPDGQTFDDVSFYEGEHNVISALNYNWMLVDNIKLKQDDSRYYVFTPIREFPDVSVSSRSLGEGVGSQDIKEITFKFTQTFTQVLGQGFTIPFLEKQITEIDYVFDITGACKYTDSNGLNFQNIDNVLQPTSTFVYPDEDSSSTYKGWYVITGQLAQNRTELVNIPIEFTISVKYKQKVNTP
jgi:hypothetical protein